MCRRFGGVLEASGGRTVRVPPRKLRCQDRSATATRYAVVLAAPSFPWVQHLACELLSFVVCERTDGAPTVTCERVVRALQQTHLGPGSSPTREALCGGSERTLPLRVQHCAIVCLELVYVQSH